MGERPSLPPGVLQMWLYVKKCPIGSGTHGRHMQTHPKGCSGHRELCTRTFPACPANCLYNHILPKLFSISLPLLFLFLGCMCLHGVCVCVTPTIGLHLIFGSWDLSPVLTVCLDWLTIMPQYTCPHKHGHEHTHAHAHTHHSPPSTRIKCRTVPQP